MDIEQSETLDVYANFVEAPTLPPPAPITLKERMALLDSILAAHLSEDLAEIPF